MEKALSSGYSLKILTFPSIVRPEVNSVEKKVGGMWVKQPGCGTGGKGDTVGVVTTFLHCTPLFPVHIASLILPQTAKSSLRFIWMEVFEEKGLNFSF